MQQDNKPKFTGIIYPLKKSIIFVIWKNDRPFLIALVRNENDCQFPKHNEYLEVFLKKCPTADRNARFFVVNLMDPEKCNVMDDSKKNTQGAV